MTLATGHKSKGLEFDEVFICDDFIQLRHGVPALEPEVAEEVNLLLANYEERPLPCRPCLSFG